MSKKQLAQPLRPHEDDYPDVLDLPIVSGPLSRTLSVRDYFAAMLDQAWIEGALQGKLSWAQSPWKMDLYLALVKGGYVPGAIGTYSSELEHDVEVTERWIRENILARL